MNKSPVQLKTSKREGNRRDRIASLPILIAVLLVPAGYLIAIMMQGERIVCPLFANCEGIVTLDGHPLANAEIELANRQSISFAKSNDLGEFRVMTGSEERAYNGTPPGLYRVMVSAASPKSPSQNTPSETTPCETTLEVPAIYSDPVKTPLTIRIRETGISDWKLELDSGAAKVSRRR